MVADRVTALLLFAENLLRAVAADGGAGELRGGGGQIVAREAVERHAVILRHAAEGVEVCPLTVLQIEDGQVREAELVCQGHHAQPAELPEIAGHGQGLLAGGLGFHSVFILSNKIENKNTVQAHPYTVRMETTN